MSAEGELHPTARFLMGPGPSDVHPRVLKAGLAHLAELVDKQLGRQVEHIPGAGAAGGLGAGAAAFLNGRLVSGIETVMSQSGLHEALVDADWVITGEGGFDRQSLRGKVVSGVARAAKRTNTKVAVLAGRVLLAPEEYRSIGVIDALACADDGMELEYAMQNSERLLAEAAKDFVLRHLVG